LNLLHTTCCETLLWRSFSLRANSADLGPWIHDLSWSGRLQEESRGSTISQHGNNFSTWTPSYSITLFFKRSKVFSMTLLCDNGLGMNLRKCRLCTKKDLATFELVLFGRQRCIKILYFHHQLCWDSCTATDLLS
jgi:hypothetical protein